MKYFYFSIFVVAFTDVSAQDPSFSQIENTLLNSHPSFTSGYDYNLGTALRVQWPKIPGGFNTAFLTFNGNLHKGLSLGLSYIRDQEGVGNIGIMKTDEPKLIVRYRCTPIKKDQYLTGSLSFGPVFKQINSSELIFSDQIDPVLGISDQPVFTYANKSFFDCDASINYFINGKFPCLFAFSVHHLTNPDESLLPESESILPPKVIFTYSSRQLWEKEENSLYLDGVFQIEFQKQLQKMIIGPLMTIPAGEHKIPIGLFYSGQHNAFNSDNTNSLILELGFHFYDLNQGEKKYYSYQTLNLSFDWPCTGMAFRGTTGSYELTWNFYFGKCKNCYSGIKK